MYIQPNSTVKLLKNVPLDKTYEHSVNFDTKAHQTSWFESYIKTGMVFTQQYYTRHSRNAIKLEVLADNVYDCNYVMFQNTTYGTKWFYAFITNIEYINDNVTLVEFEIDDLQTWLFDFTLLPCFVEREHSLTDTIGDNLLPENFDLGDVFAKNKTTFISSQSTGYTNLVIVVAATFDMNYNDNAGGKYTGAYSGLCYNIFTGAFMIDDAANFINMAGTRMNNIINVFYAFRDLVAVQKQDFSGYVASENPIVISVTGPKTFADFDGYTPKNNKMYTFPYCFLRVKDGFGNYADYKYEYFNTSPEFDMTGDLSPTPSVICIPKNYMGETKNYTESAILTGFPQCAWNSDAFIAWLAQTGIRLGSEIIGGAVDGFVGGAYQASKGKDTSALRGTVEGIGRNLQGEVTNVLQGFATVMANRRQVTGTQGSVLAVTADMMFIEGEQMQIRGEYAQIIDSFWTKFGYPVRKVKTPNYSARPYWNYVKTVGCMAKGSLPSDAMTRICNIFDNGITWWSRTATVGDYTQNNSVPI